MTSLRCPHEEILQNARSKDFHANAHVDLNFRWAHMPKVRFLTWSLKNFIISNNRGNNLCHQYGDMHIAATASVVRIYAKIMKSA